MSEQDKDNNENKSMKIVFAEGCFDDFDGTQEELDELVTQLTEMAESGELLDNSTPIEFEELGYNSAEELVEDIANKAREIDEQYGFDEDGFVKFPFTNTRH